MQKSPPYSAPATEPTSRISRRGVSLLLLAGGFVSVAGVVHLVGERGAVSVAQAAQYIQQSGDKLLAILNGPGDDSSKFLQAEGLIAETVDVDGVVRFALGRFLSLASEQQRAELVRLFPAVLIGGIARSIGGYQNLTFTVDRGVQVDDKIQVFTTVMRPGEPTRKATWIVGSINGAPKIIDVLAEGASMRITERDDCASVLAQNNHSISALIEILQRQAQPAS